MNKPAAIFVGACLALSARADLADPRTGAPDGGPVAILFLTDGAPVDPKYEAELKELGYRTVNAALANRLSMEYLKQFGVVVLSRLPFAGQQYTVGGEKLVHTATNLAMIARYIADGGGVIFEPAMSEYGEAYAEIYNSFLKPYSVRYIPQQLRHDSETKGAYAAGLILQGHEITAGLAAILYPINVLRWDHAYSTTPFVTEDKAWIILAAGKPGSGTHQALDNSRVGDQLTAHNSLFAMRQAGRGLIAVSAIHSYYTLTHAWSEQPNIGENDTGVIAGIVLHGEKDGRPSDFSKLFDRTCRFIAANSAKNGVGAGQVELPPQEPPIQTSRIIDWHTAQPPPTWKHRVIATWVEGSPYYDEHPDPAVPGDVKFYKALIGPRTSLGGGRGTVREYREAAQKAGYSVLIFCEPLEKMDSTKWEYLVADCRANSDDNFICLPGLDITDFQGGRYLVLCSGRFPDPSWLTPDGKKLEAVRMLSLGWYGHLAAVHRAGRSQLHPKMYKHYQGITVYTYDANGRLVDDALHAYQWAVRSDSNPFPIVAHELEAPDQVAKAAETGFQQILPGPDLASAVDYFRFALPHYFDCPARYFITEGPILDGWSILNKDLGNPAENRDHYRLLLGVTNDVPIAEVTLYDGFEVAGRWRPNAPAFRILVDGFHDRQREYMALATDARGRRVLSPGIRTVTRNWRLRCGDRQNWLGSMYIYTGWYLPGFGGYSVPLRNTREGGTAWLGAGGGNPCPIFDFPFFSNHAQIMDVDLSTKYVDTDWDRIGGDAKPVYAVRPVDFVAGQLQTVYPMPKNQSFAVAMARVTITVKRDVEPAGGSPVFPVIANAMSTNNLLILPDKPPARLSRVYENGRIVDGDQANRTVDLPVGAYVGGIIPLTPGLRLHERSIGFPAPSPDALTLYEGTAWTAEYLVLKSSPFHWRSMQTGYDTDALAERALNHMGFRGTPPYSFALKQGRAEKPAYWLDCTAEHGGIAGVCRNDRNEPILHDIPMRIRGLNPRTAAAVWRSDSKTLDYFACFREYGLVTFNADRTVDFYAGNVALCDSNLFVSVVIWNESEAWFRIQNPTARDITTDFQTPEAIRNFKHVKTSITVKAGDSVDVKMQP